MAFDRFLIAPINEGLVTYGKSWLQPKDAFEYLQNVYVFRGRLRKRFGSRLMGTTPLNSRLRISLASGGAGIGITNGSGNATGNVRTILSDSGLILGPGQMFSVGSETFTVSVVGNPTIMLSTQHSTIGTTDGSGNAAGTVAGGAGTIGQVFTIGSQSFTVTLVNGALTASTGPGTGTFNTTTGAYTFTGAAPLTSIVFFPAVGTLDTSTGAFVFTGAAATLTTIFFYPALPVMGIDQYLINAINNHPTYAFDTRYAYTFNSGTGFWDRVGTATNWQGTDLNYFWAANWESASGTKLLFVTNFNATVPTTLATDDPMYYFNGTTFTNFSNKTIFLTGGNIVSTALIIVAFKNRLLLLNTIEAAATGVGQASVAHVNRCRYSWNGDPTATNAWLEPNQTTGGTLAAGAGYIDASTEEAIISVGFVKDRLIVYFERSTWELAYTGNEILPFVWQRLNNELGSQSTFSAVQFDTNLLAIGNTGAHACNGSNVRRIDEKIPDIVFDFKAENNAPARSCGVRDFYSELVYWAYVADWAIPTQKFPTTILVYNYQAKSWSQNDDCFTAFGYFEQQSDMTWSSSSPLTWENINSTWTSNVIQANQRQILGGTPEGFVIQLDPESDRNAPSMSISNMSFDASGSGIITLTIIDHNLNNKPSELDFDYDFILIENVVGDAVLQASINGRIYAVDTVVDKDTITINTNGSPPNVIIPTGDYQGSGTATRVSNIQIITKNFNPYVEQNRNVYVAKADFAVERTTDGEITVDYRTSTAPLPMIAAGENSLSIVGNNVLETRPYSVTLYPLEQYQDLLWHPIYFQSSGEFIKLVMYFNATQMITPTISLAPFEIEAIALYCQPTSDRMQ